MSEETVLSLPFMDEKYPIEKEAYDKLTKNTNRNDYINEIVPWRDMSLSRDGTYPKGLMVNATAVCPTKGIVTPELGKGVSLYRVVTLDKEEDSKDRCESFKDAVLQQRLQNLINDSVPDKSNNAWCYDTEKRDGPDAYFEPELGNQGRISLVRGRREDGRYKDIFLIVMAYPESAARELCERAAKKNWTLYDLMESNRYKKLMEQSSNLRNQIAAKAGEALGLSREMPTYDEKNGIVEPSVECVQNCLYRLKDGNILYYNNVYNTRETKRGILTGIDPERGYLMFDGNPKTAELDSNSVSNGGYWTNADSYNMFPTGTGRRLKKQEFELLDAGTAMTAKQRKKLNSMLGWQSDMPFNRNAIPSVYNDFKSANLKHYAEDKLGYSRNWNSPRKLFPIVCRVPSEPESGMSTETILNMTDKNSDKVYIPLSTPILAQMVSQYPSFSKEIEARSGEPITLAELFADQDEKQYIRMPREYLEIFQEMQNE